MKKELIGFDKKKYIIFFFSEEMVHNSKYITNFSNSTNF